MTDNGKVAIVTGASRGIGLEITRQLLAMGMTVVAVDIREDLLAEMPKAPDKCVAYVQTFIWSPKKQETRLWLGYNPDMAVWLNGRKIHEVRGEDVAYELLISKTTDTLLFFSDQGKVYASKVYEIPESGPMSKGRSIANLVQSAANERITACMSIKDFSSETFVFMATRLGKVKKTSLAEFENTRKKGIIAIKLANNDRLIAAKLTSGKDSVLLTTRDGLSLRFKEKLARPMGRNAAGVKGIRLGKGNEVVGFNIARVDEDMLIVGERGIGKRVKFDAIGEKGRGGKGMKAMTIDTKTGKVAGVANVSDDDDLIVMTKVGKVIRTPVNEIKQLSRVAKGVKVIALAKDDSVVSIAPIKAQV
jgi:DNA gyrase subunit A